MPPMGGVTGAMRGTNRRGIGAKAARPKNMKHTVMRLFSYMKKMCGCWRQHFCVLWQAQLVRLPLPIC